MRSALLYGLGLAAGAFALRWLEHHYWLRLVSAEVYVVLIALAFTGLGAWLGHRLTRGDRPAFTKNSRALDTLGISDREYEVLTLLAEGHSNREIAERLFISPNTVKTHLVSLYGKLGVTRRTRAVSEARRLQLIP